MVFFDSHYLFSFSYFLTFNSLFTVFCYYPQSIFFIFISFHSVLLHFYSLVAFPYFATFNSSFAASFYFLSITFFIFNNLFYSLCFLYLHRLILILPFCFITIFPSLYNPPLPSLHTPLILIHPFSFINNYLLSFIIHSSTLQFPHISLYLTRGHPQRPQTRSLVYFSSSCISYVSQEGVGVGATLLTAAILSAKLNSLSVYFLLLYIFPGPEISLSLVSVSLCFIFHVFPGRQHCSLHSTLISHAGLTSSPFLEVLV